jgi:hypothetical protein
VGGILPEIAFALPLTAVPISSDRACLENQGLDENPPLGSVACGSIRQVGSRFCNDYSVQFWTLRARPLVIKTGI